VGAYLERTYKLTNKGVHASVSKLEAVKTVFHVYLIAADLLDYLRTSSPTASGKLNVYTASIDELESVLGVSRSIAKAIIRARAENEEVTIELIGKIRGVGPKTFRRIADTVVFAPRSA